jgi:cytochrome c
MRGSRTTRVVSICVIASLGLACRPSARSEASMITGGDIERGRSAIGKYGCAACHTIPGIRGANATVGPPLNRIAVRGYLGGHLTNSPANMILWIQKPQEVDPKNVMPNMGVTDQDARDIAAYLYTLR